ncbi:MAG: PAS domain S-box protein [Chloroflexota bacterium]
MKKTISNQSHRAYGSVNETENDAMNSPLGDITLWDKHLINSVFENVNVWLNVLDHQRNIVLWNGTAEKLSGYSREEVLGHSDVWSWLYPNEAYLTQILDAVNQMIGTDRDLENFETKILCKDGNERMMSWNARRILDDRGEIQGAINFGYDITERRQAREALQKAHHELSVLYEIASIANSSSSLNAILDQSLQQVLSTMACEKGFVHLIDPGGNTLQLSASQGLSENAIAQLDAAPTDRDLAGRVFTSGESVAIPYLADELNRLQSVPSHLLHSYLGAPIKTKGRVLGVFSILGKGGQTFSAEQSALLASIANQVGVAVENSNLNQKSRQLAVIEERQRLARDLHDSVAQSLYSLMLFAETGIRTNRSGDQETTEIHLTRLSKTAHSALKEMRLLVYELRPPDLEEHGLIQSIQTRLESVERRAGIRVRFFADALIELSSSIEYELYYFVQEALNNALKHAAAETITVRIQATEDHIVVEIVDDGLGFQVDTVAAGGVGLLSMRERIKKIGGDMKLISAIGEGTNVTAIIERMGEKIDEKN